jgi:hypothetical protein
MAPRPKKAQPAQDAENPAQPQTELPATGAPGANETPSVDSPAADAPAANEAPEAGKSQWGSRIGGGWTDAEAGVHLNEDHRNRRMTIQFDEKPPEAVRKLMKEESGYRFDGENQLWYKRINLPTARQSREEAEAMAFQVANMIRQERGLEQKTSFLLGM